MPPPRSLGLQRVFALAALLGTLVLATAVAAAGASEIRVDPGAAVPGNCRTAGAFDIGVLVFREGLECVLVLAAVTASFKGAERKYHRPVAAGMAMALAATLVTWFVAVRLLDDLSTRMPALALQAGMGLLAIVALLVVMNWFFHKVYWTGWITFHNQRKTRLLRSDKKKAGVLFGMASLGFTSFYREGFEVVLFLQGYRLRLGTAVVTLGVLIGILGTGVVAILTFLAHRRLPYRNMLVATGVMLAFVLLVMVGEQAQEMQLAGWLPATKIPRLEQSIPSWMSLWLSVFATVETLCAQALAGLLVFGSYIAARSVPTTAR